MNTERDHLDAETVAAWLDGGLDPVSLAAAEAHASNCARCQALLATMVKTEPLGPRDEARGTGWIWKWWLAPLAATAAAVTLWMVVPQQQLQPDVLRAPQAESDAAAPAVGARASDEAARKEQAAEPQPAQQPGRRLNDGGQFAEVKRKADTSQPAANKPEFAQDKLGAATANVANAAAARDRQDAKTEESRLARVEAEPARAPAAVAAAPPPAAAAPAEAGALREDAPATQLRKQAGPLQILSPDPRFRWRVTADGIELSQDGSRTWLTVRLPQGEVLTAGASPAPLVCWMVGRRGLVLVATDGTNFTKVPFPETVDLAAVSSPELRVAIVTTADGRIFRTENAGRTWIRQ